MSQPRSLSIHYLAEPAVVFALKTARNHLEARALVAEQAGPAGPDPERARWCRRQADHLSELLGQLGVAAEPPRPELAAVHEPEGVYAVDGGKVIRLVPRPQLDELFGRAAELNSQRSPSLADVIQALAAATSEQPRDVLRQVAHARAAVRDETDARRIDLEVDLDFGPPR